MTRDAALAHTRSTAPTGPRVQRAPPGRAPAAAARGRRPDAERSRRRALLEGVRQPDRARQDPADARDDRVARGAARRRSRLPRERCLDRRARPARRRARSRRGADRVARGTTRRSRSTSRSPALHGDRRRPSSRFARSSAPAWAQMQHRRVREGARAARTRPASLVEAAQLLGPRPRRRPLPRSASAATSFRACRPRSGSSNEALSPRRALRPAVRRAPLGDPFLALALLAPPARLRGRARGHRARAGARRGANDPRTIGGTYFQASLVAEREGHWVLARNYAERARAAVRGAQRPGATSGS